MLAPSSQAIMTRMTATDQFAPTAIPPTRPSRTSCFNSASSLPVTFSLPKLRQCGRGTKRRPSRSQGTFDSRPGSGSDQDRVSDLGLRCRNDDATGADVAGSPASLGAGRVPIWWDSLGCARRRADGGLDHAPSRLAWPRGRNIRTRGLSAPGRQPVLADGRRPELPRCGGPSAGTLAPGAGARRRAVMEGARGLSCPSRQSPVSNSRFRRSQGFCRGHGGAAACLGRGCRPGVRAAVRRPA